MQQTYSTSYLFRGYLCCHQHFESSLAALIMQLVFSTSVFIGPQPPPHALLPPILPSIGLKKMGSEKGGSEPQNPHNERLSLTSAI